MVAKNSPAKRLLDAIKFIKPAQKKTGGTMQTHCMLQGGWIVATNGTLTIGCQIEEDLNLCPQTFQFEDALKNVGSEMSISELEGQLSVLSGAFRAVIPCAQTDQLAIQALDPCYNGEYEAISDVFARLLPLTTDKAKKPWQGSILVNPAVAVATNGEALAEIEHGMQMPTFQIPRRSAQAVVKSKKLVTGLGFSGPSVTFWFDDGSFIKSMCYEPNFPSYDSLLSENIDQASEVSPHFFRALKSIKNFAQDGLIYFKDSKICSTGESKRASTYEIEDLPDFVGFDSKNLLAVEKMFKFAKFGNEEDQTTYFFDENTRGIVNQVCWNDDEPADFDDFDEPPF